MKEYENRQNRIKGMMQIFKVQDYKEGKDILIRGKETQFLIQGPSFWGSIECWFARRLNERAAL